MNHLYIIVLLIILSVVSVQKVLGQKIPELCISKDVSKEERVQKMDDWLNRLQQENKFNGAVLIVKNGEPILKNAYGFTDANKDVPLTPLSSFRLASLSKQFTAAAIMLLHDQEKLQFDDLVSKQIKGFPYTGVTIRHLLNHTSGIPDNYLMLAYLNAKKFDILSVDKAVELVIEANKKAKNKPNVAFRYNNTNYVLLAKIVENISEVSFEKFMSQHFFEPLNMPQTRVWNLLSEDKTFEHKTSSFKNNGPNPKAMEPDIVDGVSGDGAVFSSINDMLIWDSFWNGNELISEAAMQEAIKKPTLEDGTISSYGFGWSISNNAMIHDGSWLGARTFINRNTALKNCLVILDNSKNPLIDDIANVIAKNLDY